MTTKIGWGTRVALLYGGFVAIIVILIVGSMRQDFDLVSKDYYAEEIAYQNTIDASSNQAALSAPATVAIGADHVTISLPQEFKDKVVNADLHFYSPISASLDRKFNEHTDNGDVVLMRGNLKNERYKLKMNWESEGKKYYQESDVDLK